MPNDPVAANSLAFAVRFMERSERGINSCLDRLTPEQMLYRGGDNENSIANLLLHLAGNLRQWILHGIDGQPDVRTRDDEFSLTLQLPLDEIRARFAATLAECRADRRHPTRAHAHHHQPATQRRLGLRDHR